ncbi:MAG: hypothetical protein DDT34_00606 [Firmicutes bacterium]|nr:hypothetical protein [Bacillota bacterium]MBT9151847.1 hypothetical protein [Bacillota bacterium]MBT9157652.1 hypothetical protein [Bacillota bacterium]
MNKFFHLPSLFVYLVAAVLLVTSIYHGAAFLRHGFYAVLGLTDANVLPQKFSTDQVTFTPDAEAYLRAYEDRRQTQLERVNILRSMLLLVFSLSFFAWFWSRTSRSQDFAMIFSVNNFYFFLVSMISFFIFFFAASQGIGNAVTSVIFPESNFYFNYQGGFARPAPIPETKVEPRTVTLSELEAALETQMDEHHKQNAPWQTRQMVDQFAVSLVSLPVFYLHNRKFKF